MESDNLSCEQVSSALTSAGIGNHAVRPQNGRLFPLTANSDHGFLLNVSKTHGRYCLHANTHVYMKFCQIARFEINSSK